MDTNPEEVKMEHGLLFNHFSLTNIIRNSSLCSLLIFMRGCHTGKKNKSTAKEKLKNRATKMYSLGGIQILPQFTLVDSDK